MLVPRDTYTFVAASLRARGICTAELMATTVQDGEVDGIPTIFVSGCRAPELSSMLARNMDGWSVHSVADEFWITQD